MGPVLNPVEMAMASPDEVAEVGLAQLPHGLQRSHLVVGVLHAHQCGVVSQDRLEQAGGIAGGDEGASLVRVGSRWSTANA